MSKTGGGPTYDIHISTQNNKNQNNIHMFEDIPTKMNMATIEQ